VISDRHKFIHIHIPKTGGTSVSVALGYPEGKTPDHRRARVIKKGVKDWDSYFKFTFVRNPWDLVVSDFFARNGKDFKEFVLRIPKWDNQCYFILDSSGKSLVDFIGRFENLHKDFDHICNRIGIKANLFHFRNTLHGHYSKYYDDETREKVARLFRQDIEYFGFEGV